VLAVRAGSSRVLSRQNSFVASKSATKRYRYKDLEFCRQKRDLRGNATRQEPITVPNPDVAINAGTEPGPSPLVPEEIVCP
jgi:hypothetical protein